MQNLKTSSPEDNSQFASEPKISEICSAISSKNAVQAIWTLQKLLEYHPVIAWVLFTGGKKFGKTHPTWLTPTVRRIQRCIICRDRSSLLGGDVWRSLTEILLHRYIDFEAAVWLLGYAHTFIQQGTLSCLRFRAPSVSQKPVNRN